MQHAAMHTQSEQQHNHISTGALIQVAASTRSACLSYESRFSRRSIVCAAVSQHADAAHCTGCCMSAAVFLAFTHRRYLSAKTAVARPIRLIGMRCCTRCCSNCRRCSLLALLLIHLVSLHPSARASARWKRTHATVSVAYTSCLCRPSSRNQRGAEKVPACRVFLPPVVLAQRCFNKLKSRHDALSSVNYAAITFRQCTDSYLRLS